MTRLDGNERDGRKTAQIVPILSNTRPFPHRETQPAAPADMPCRKLPESVAKVVIQALGLS